MINFRFRPKKPMGLRATLKRSLANSLAQTGATLPFTHVPSLLVPIIAKIKHTRYSSWQTKSSSQLPLLPDSFSFFEELAVARPRFACCELPRLRCHGHKLLLPMQDKREEFFFLQRLRTSLIGSNSPPPGLSRIQASPARHLLALLLPFLTSGPDLGV